MLKVDIQLEHGLLCVPKYLETLNLSLNNKEWTHGQLREHFGKVAYSPFDRDVYIALTYSYKQQTPVDPPHSERKATDFAKTPTIFSQVTDAAPHRPHQLFNASVNSSLRSAKITNNLCELIGLCSHPSIHLENEMLWKAQVQMECSHSGAERVSYIYESEMYERKQSAHIYKISAGVLKGLKVFKVLRSLESNGVGMIKMFAQVLNLIFVQLENATMSKMHKNGLNNVCCSVSGIKLSE